MTLAFDNCNCRGHTGDINDINGRDGRNDECDSDSECRRDNDEVNMATMAMTVAMTTTDGADCLFFCRRRRFRCRYKLDAAPIRISACSTTTISTTTRALLSALLMAAAAAAVATCGTACAFSFRSRPSSSSSSSSSLSLLSRSFVPSSSPHTAAKSAGMISPRSFLPMPFVSLLLSSPSPSSSLMRRQMSSYDMSDYSSSSSDYDIDDDDNDLSGADSKKSAYGRDSYRDDYDDDDNKGEEVKLHTPVPLSKNSGNRFVALVFDKALDRNGRDWEELVDNRTALTHNHVWHCRASNLYNETFNVDSMVDVLHSYQVLSSCATRPIGHILILESTDLRYIYEFVESDPVVKSLNCTIHDVPIYRWRHIKDHTLRIDDGRYGWPNVLIQLDRTDEDAANLLLLGKQQQQQRRRRGGDDNYDDDDNNDNNNALARTAISMKDVRASVELSKLEYLIRSERVIAAGPLHIATHEKTNSTAIGDLIFFNAYNRSEAIAFAENDPASLAGLYQTMKVHRYNALDVTGKFVSETRKDDGSCGWYNHNAKMKREMEGMGYPVDDEQTPWLNW